MATTSTITMAGLDAFKAHVQALPAAMTAGLKATAITIASKIHVDASRNLLAATASDKTPDTQADATAAAITTVVDEDKKTVFVVSPGVAEDPANNPIWLEHGTIHEAPKPYMLPATKAHEAEYYAAQARTVARVAQELFG